MSISMEKKIVIVTGGSRGIGKAIAEEFINRKQDKKENGLKKAKKTKKTFIL